MAARFMGRQDILSKRSGFGELHGGKQKRPQNPEPTQSLRGVRKHSVQLQYPQAEDRCQGYLGRLLGKIIPVFSSPYLFSAR